MDGSRRSAKSNAFFTGFGRKKRIALFDTLIKKHPQQELVAVLAHEIGHSKLNHVSKKLILSALQMGLLLGLLSVLLRYEPMFQAFGLEQTSVHAGLFIFLLLYTPVSQLLAIGTQYISRRHEFEADAFAARTTGHPEMLVQALQRLSEENLSNLTPHPLKVWLEYSHPPVTERIRALLRL
jgi:STE24 endopeptidase